MKELPLFITGNEFKAREIGRHLNMELPHAKVEVAEIQSLSLSEVVEYKAREAYKQVNRPVLVEDTALTFTSLNQLPGPLIKWFFESLGNDGLCKILDSYKDRTARAEVRFGLCNGNEVLQFYGTAEGTIADVSRGETTFGWDPIFIPKGYDKTWGEMSWEEKDATSMRMIALKKLEVYLKDS